eukprot:g1995.t1
MEKQKEYDWKDSNMALFGSDLEKNIKKAAAEGEEQWKGAGSEVGLKVWRIEQFKVVEWPRRRHGEFHEGDTYIVLNTYKPEPDPETGEAPDKLAWDIHFWIGTHSTQDEYGTAAYKTVELDHLLDDAAIQHREVMGHESELFLSYFVRGIKLLEGGTASGFRHVEEEVVETRLFQVKGVKGNLVLRQTKLSRSKMNSGDVFILDTGDVCYQWNGKEANVHEKRQAAEFCMALKSDRSGRCEVMTMDEGASDGKPDDEADPFWKHLPGKRKMLGITIGSIEVRGADDKKAGDDADVQARRLALYRIHEGVGLHAGKVRFTKCSVGAGDKVPKNLLNTGDVMLLDTGFHLFVWVGSGASTEEKQAGFPYAHRYIQDQKRPPVMPVTRLMEGRENAKFLEFVGPAVAQGCCTIC